MAVFRPSLITGALVLTLSEPAATPEDQARQLFSRADSQYQTADYVGAAASFREAFIVAKEIEDPELRANVQSAIIFNLARANVKAYGTDPKPAYLRQAIELLEDRLGAQAGVDPEAEALLAEARALLAQVESETESESGPVQPAPSLDEIERREGESEDRGGTVEGVDRSKRTRLEVVGYTTMGLSVIGFGMLGGGAAISTTATSDYEGSRSGEEREDAERQGRLGNTLIVTGAVAGGVLLTTGAVLSLVGRRRRGTSVASVRVVPQASSNQAGVVLSGRF